MKNKFIDIYNNLNDTDIPNEKKEIKNEGNKKNKKEDKPLVLFFIEDRLQKIKNIIYNTSLKAFEKFLKQFIKTIQMICKKSKVLKIKHLV